MRLSHAALIALGLSAAPVQAVTLIYDDFSSTAGLQVNGDASSVHTGGRDVMRLTPRSTWQSGSIFSTEALTFGANYSFSTRFTFNINQSSQFGADGLVFVIQPNANDVGSQGEGIGYGEIAHSLGVEFDTYFNDTLGDPNDNHVGIDLNGSVNSVVSATPGFAMESGQDITSWIDYDGATLSVRLAMGAMRPESALLSYDLDLAALIGSTNAFVGFTSATGGYYANHDLVSWEFRDTFDPIDAPDPDPVDAVPEPASWAMMIAGFAIAGYAMRRRRNTLGFA